MNLRPLSKLFLTMSLLAVLLVSLGCAERTILVHDGVPVKVAEGRVKIYVQQNDGTWVKGGNWLPVPEGWYLVPPPKTQEK